MESLKVVCYALSSCRVDGSVILSVVKYLKSICCNGCSRCNCCLLCVVWLSAFAIRHSECSEKSQSLLFQNSQLVIVVQYRNQLFFIINSSFIIPISPNLASRISPLKSFVRQTVHRIGDSSTDGFGTHGQCCNQQRHQHHSQK